MTKKILLGFIAFVVVTAVAVNVAFAPARPAYAFAPTPQTFNASRADAGIVVWASAKTITADTRVCQDTRNYNAADVQWVTDQGTANSTTIKLQFSNDGVNFTDGATLVSSNTSDSSDLNRQLLYGRYSCVYFDVTNTNPLVVTAIGVAK